MRSAVVAAVAGVFLSMVVAGAAGQSPAVSRDVASWMARVGERIGAYYTRAQSVICEETVRLEPLGHDLMTDGSHIRVLVYELRVAWDGTSDGQDGSGAPAATVLRQLLTVDGRPPKPGFEPGCMDPKAVSPEPLGMLLPHRQPDFVFSWRGPGRERGRASVTLDYKSARIQPPNIVWKENCVSIDLPGRTRGRIWLDQATGDVLRLDEELTGQYEVVVPREQARKPGVAPSFTVERADSSIAYRPVTFSDPEEIVMLPESIVSLQIIRNSGVPRLRTTQRFSKYRRFITGGRIVEEQSR
jgi:hypothetical protein